MRISIEARNSEKYGEVIYFLTKPGFPKRLILSADEMKQIAEFADEHEL